MPTPTALIVGSILPHPAVSGAQRRTLRLLEAMERAGARPHLIVTAGDANDEPATELRERGWGVDVYPEPRPTVPGRLRQHLMRLPSPYVPGVERRLRELCANEAAFVQFEHAQNSYYHAAVGSLPIVLSTHNVDAELISSLAGGAPRFSLDRQRLRFRAGSMRRAEQRAARAADTVVCVSDHDAARFRRHGAARVLVVPNGVDDELFEIGPPPEDSEKGVLFFGLLSYPPNTLGIARFVREGWPALARKHPRAVLRIAGAGASPELVATLHGAERVEFLGAVDDIAVELARANVVLVPIWQGAGTRLKVLESLAAARPVVGTPLGVERIGFEPGRDGLVGESPAELAEAVAMLLADRARASTLARQGRSLARTYRWRDVVRPVEELYRGWIAAARGR